MQKKSYVVWIYAMIVLVGGIIGYQTANSLPSLIASTLIAIILAGCGYGIKKGYATAYYASLAVLFFVLAFFGYRFSLAFKFMPAGMMFIITGVVLAYLFANRKQVTCACSKKIS
ncbi:TMEM14 family protein [Candidatus Protochlamydia phocaeensis]|uniref:TMEM14 family protein n=1 Tax=Candidatus Protochlamydia phocaeensis TaxID=1414722 RepID=UPI000838A22F|nr:TMEM14 family protein [Candidatus Protochlamydia phocaeensis]